MIKDNNYSLRLEKNFFLSSEPQWQPGDGPTVTVARAKVFIVTAWAGPALLSRPVREERGKYKLLLNSRTSKSIQWKRLREQAWARAGFGHLFWQLPIDSDQGRHRPWQFNLSDRPSNRSIRINMDSHHVISIFHLSIFKWIHTMWFLLSSDFRTWSFESFKVEILRSFNTTTVWEQHPSHYMDYVVQ